MSNILNSEEAALQCSAHFLPEIKIIKSEKTLDEFAVYVHIPFCVKKCNFCSIPVFLTENETIINRYVEDLSTVFRSSIVQDRIRKGILVGVHVGGGTPSILNATQISFILDCIMNECGTKVPEIVFEANPESLTSEKIDLLSSYGNVTLNIGVQSFSEVTLLKANRSNNTETIKEMLSYAVSKDSLNVGIDLIVGLPFSNAEMSKKDIFTANELGIENIFLYPFRCENGSMFYKDRNSKGYLTPNSIADIMQDNTEILCNLEYKPRSIYYWTKSIIPLYKYTENQMNGGEWVGIGSGAVSYIDEKLYQNPFFCLKDFFSERIEHTKTVDYKKFDKTSEFIWDLCFMLRRGVFETARILDKYGACFEDVLQRIKCELIGNEILKNNMGQLVMTTKGIVHLDRVEEMIVNIVYSKN